MNILKKLWWKCRQTLSLVRGAYRHTGERVCPDFPDENFENHLKVYQFAEQFVKGKIVLDVGCGTGYGADYLAQHGAKSVFAIDYSPDAINYAKGKYGGIVEFRQMDAQEITYPSDSFDVVISSENLEHLPNPSANIAQIRRVLKKGGILILGTPNKEIASPGSEKSSNPFHMKEFYYEDLETLVKKYFRSVHIFENTLESPSDVGRMMKEERRRKGKIGLEPRAIKTIQLGKLRVNLTHLHNTHSFTVLAW
jgi:2-polyprenyl-3-methyl-5-hydroxy-6-metoxy-1,4-benzoquinol methylase